MRNPWLKKNPWLSIWLSGVNTVSGAARAQVLRNANRMIADSVTRAVDAWSAALPLLSPAKPARKRPKR